MTRVTLAEFPALALARFPALAEEFADYDGLAYLQMAAVAHLAQRAKGRAAWDEYTAIVRFVDELWGQADEGLHNAINVSFLEHVDFEGPRGPSAWACLPPRLQRAWRAMDAYNTWLHAGAKGNPPPEAAV